MTLKTEFPFLYSYATPEFIQRLEPLLNKKAIPVQNIKASHHATILVKIKRGCAMYSWYGCDVCAKKSETSFSLDEEFNCLSKRCHGTIRKVMQWYSMSFLTEKDDINSEEIVITIFSKEPLHYYQFLKNKFVINGLFLNEKYSLGSMEFRQFSVRKYELYSETIVDVPATKKVESLTTTVKNLFSANQNKPIPKNEFDQWLKAKNLNAESVYILPILKIENDAVMITNEIDVIH